MITLLLLAGFAAQSFTSLSGSLADPQGGVLPGVRLALADPERQTRHEVVSDRTGHFEFAGLVPGTYQLTAVLPGFMPYRATIALSAAPASRAITLEIGHLQETITVTEPDGTPQGPPPPPRPARPTPACTPAPASPGPAIGGNLRPPAKVRDVRPIFPESRRGSGVDTVVVLEAVIGRDGLVQETRPQDGSDPAFADALATAVSQWQFESTLLNCQPVEVKMTVTGTFKHRP
jgi:hypothetical protein